ncbi:MAG TPA: hypothetical protein DDW30_03995 [Clostridiales bacterium]|nr:hypothetical protein [Clostridiales bacterium]
MVCEACGKPIDSIDIGAYRKLMDKSAKAFLCRECLAARLGWTREYLDGVILMYRKRGCTLFPPLADTDN